MQLANNQLVPFTRREHKLPQKVLKRDSEITKKIMHAWDSEQDAEKVFRIFEKENKNLSDYRYWEVLRTIWIIAGHSKYLKIFYRWFTSDRKQKWCFMTPEESKKLREMPNPITCYRAINEGQKNFSWTISLEYAQKYAEMFGKPIIQKMEITKDEIFAFIDRNMEDEILVLDPSIMEEST